MLWHSQMCVLSRKLILADHLYSSCISSIESLMMTDYTPLPRSSGEDELPSSGSESSWVTDSNDMQHEKVLSERLISHLRKPPFETPHIGWSCLRRLQRRFRRVGSGLLPSFISHGIGGKSTEPKTSQNVASLDGLRGVACLLVFNQHFSYSYSQTFLEGLDGEEDRNWIIQLPIIRIFWAGTQWWPFSS